MSRATARAGFTDKVRLRLVEDDLDDHELLMQQVNERLSRILWAVVGVLVSVTTSAILLAVNLGVVAR